MSDLQQDEREAIDELVKLHTSPDGQLQGPMLLVMCYIGRLEELQQERESLLDKAEAVAHIRVENPIEAIGFLEALVVQLLREKALELRRSEGFKARVGELEAGNNV